MNCEDCKNLGLNFCLAKDCRKFLCNNCKGAHGGHFCLPLGNIKKSVEDFRNTRATAKEFLGKEMANQIRAAKATLSSLTKDKDEFKAKVENRTNNDCRELIGLIQDLEEKERGYEEIIRDLEQKNEVENFKDLIENNQELKMGNKSLKDCIKEKNIGGVEKLLIKILGKAEPKIESIDAIKGAFKKINARAESCRKFYNKFDDTIDCYLNSVKFEADIKEAKAELDKYKDKRLALESKCTTIKSHISSLNDLTETYMKGLHREIVGYMKIQRKVVENAALIEHGIKDKLLESIANLTKEITTMPARLSELKLHIDMPEDLYELSSPLKILSLFNEKTQRKEDLKKIDEKEDRTVKAIYSSAFSEGEVVYNDWKLNEGNLAWVPLSSTDSTNQYIEFLFNDKFVDWVAVEMKGMRTCWVTRFKVKYWYGNDFVSLEEFGELEDKDGQDYINYGDEYDGNIDGDNPVRINLRVIIRSKGIRIYPISWKFQIAMKVNALYREVQ